MVPANNRRGSWVQEGKVPYYDGLLQDRLMLGRLYNPALIIFWVTLWSVKFSLLLLYRMIFNGLPVVYTKVWWSIVAFCIVESLTSR